MKLKQQLRQVQHLALTPHMQHSLKLLSLNILDLKQEIDKELTENPCLETHDAEPSEADERASENALHALLSSHSGEASSSVSRRDMPRVETTLSEPESLFDHLMWQARNAHFSKEEYGIAKEIIGNLTEDGFLAIDIRDIADQHKVSIHAVEIILYTVQQFDPVGVAARDLQECMMNQLWAMEDKKQCVKDAQQIVEHHLQDLMNNTHENLVKKRLFTRKRIQDATHIIRQLNPKPGYLFASTAYDKNTLTPDITLQKKSNHTYVIVLNTEDIPSLRLSRKYADILKGKGNAQDRAYVKTKLRRARQFLEAIEQRQQTLRKVIKSIFRHQTSFLEKGPNHLSPLVLRQVARDVKMHESTVSRAVNHKYIQTPHGVFALKYFFNPNLPGGAQDVGTRSVKHHIQDMIKREVSATPLSDEKICKHLKAKGITLARRTVSKYRQMLGIQAAGARKKRY